MSSNNFVLMLKSKKEKKKKKTVLGLRLGWNLCSFVLRMSLGHYLNPDSKRTFGTLKYNYLILCLFRRKIFIKKYLFYFFIFSLTKNDDQRKLFSI
jgi:hypothetical protein